MLNFMKKVLLFSVGAVLIACSSAPAQNAGDVAARVGDRAITVKELDDKWRDTDPTEQSETIQKLYDGRRNALELIIADQLLTEERLLAVAGDTAPEEQRHRVSP